MKAKKSYWTIRISTFLIQFETEEKMLQFKRPHGFGGKMYSFLAPRLKDVELIK